MKKCALVLLGLTVLPWLSHAAVPSAGNPTTFLGPNARLGLTKGISDTSAYAVAGELGQNNVRLDAGIGFIFQNNQRLKLAAEYLQQNIIYGFASGETAQWIQQGSIGANYQYDFGEYMYRYDPSFALGAYLAHSSNKGLRNNRGTYVNSTGTTIPYTDSTRIAGSTAAGLNPGLYIHPWQGAYTGADLNYDNMQYNTIYSAGNNPKGFGGTLHYRQTLDENIEATFAAGYRQPFNRYEAQISWLAIPFFGLWTISATGEYTIGKSRLPTTYNLGLGLNYLLEKTSHTSFTQRDSTIHFLEDVATPPAYMPQVFSIHDEWFR